ncbi:MAG: MerR family DNA-binding transcriptional regulator [Streptosporangiaceae bacterium]
MRISEAAERLGISPRMLRYRESLGLLPLIRPAPRAGRSRVAGLGRRPVPGSAHRQFGPADLDAVALGLAIEQRYDISPAALAFGLRVLADPAARAQVAELGRRTGRIRPLPAMAMDFEKERALRMLAGPVQASAGSAWPGASTPDSGRPGPAGPASVRPPAPPARQS